MIVRAAKASTIVGMMGAFFVHTVGGRVLKKGEAERRRWYVDQTSRYTRAGLRVLGVEVEVRGDLERLKAENCLLVGNHMSYLDILVLSSKLPCVFVTSVDMGETPVLGDLAEIGGSIFVERRNRSKVDRDISAMTNALKEGFNVVIYPEGTSTDGLRILPFKKSLLMAAVEAKRDIQPFCLRYLEIDGRPFGPENCDVTCWYGDKDFVSHLARLAGAKRIKAEIRILDPVGVTASSTRGELAEISYERISKAYFEGREELRAAEAWAGGASVIRPNFGDVSAEHARFDEPSSESSASL